MITFALFHLFSDVLKLSSRKRNSLLQFPTSYFVCFPSFAWGEDGIDELHVVGYVYQELLVYTANFTYIYATSLSTLYSLCLLYTHIQHIE